MKILLPVDGSPGALAAVRHVLRLVHGGLRASAVLANVQEPASLYEMVVAHDPKVLDDVRRAAGADLLAPAEALLEAAGVDYESEVAGGDPHSTLIELAENYGCDAIVVGARGVRDAEAAGLGTVAHALLAHAPVPVTVVRSPSTGELPEDAEPTDADAGDGAAR
jgi:nucleotide-binding universal stress UspA family protein